MPNLNASPRAILNGIQDVSTRRVDTEDVQYPQHLPWVLMLGERGETTAEVLDSSAAQEYYGAQSFDYRSKFMKHPMVMAKECFVPHANLVMYQRIRTPGSKTATIRFSLEVLEAKLTVWDRNPDGSLILDSAGKPIDTGDTVDGYKFRWLVGSAATEFKAAKKTIGTMTEAGKTSNIYPMFDADVSSFGAFGNNVGLRLSSPHVNSQYPLNQTAVEQTEGYLYRLAFIERTNAMSLPVPLRGLGDELYVDFGLKPGQYDPKTKTSYDADDVIIPSYRDVDRTSGAAPVSGPFKEFFIYRNFVDEVVSLFAEAEGNADINFDKTKKYLLNIFGAHDAQNNPYRALNVLGIFEGGESLTEQSNFFAVGGDDGDCSDEAFEQACLEEISRFGEMENQYLDLLRYPMSTLWDSGFTSEVKDAIPSLLGKRKDIWTALSTQDLTQPQNTQAVESSMAISLRARYQLQPESTLTGTGVVRGIIVGHSGYLINSEWKKLVPGTFEIAYMVSAFCSSADGQMKGENAPDIDPNNRAKLLRGLNNTWRGDKVRNKDWDNGLIFFQSYDTRSFFTAGLQTVVDNDTSILNSLINMIICVDVTKAALRTWRKFAGRSNMTPLQYEQASDKEILKQTKGRYDDRVVIQPETHHTLADTQRGFSSSARIHVYGNNMKTVAAYDVVAHRMEELNNG